MQRCRVVGEIRRCMISVSKHGIGCGCVHLAEVRQEADEVAALLGGHRRGKPLGHERPGLAPLVDVRLCDLDRLAGRGVSEREFGIRLGDFIALDHLPFDRAHDRGRETLLDLARGIENRLDKLVGWDALTGRREVRSNRSTLRPHLVAGEARKLGGREDLCPPLRIAVGFGVGEEAGDQLRIVPLGLGDLQGAGFWLRSRGLPVELWDEPIESVQVVLESLLRIIVRMAEYSDRPLVAAVADRLEELQIERTLPQWKDLLAESLAVGDHAVQVQANEMRQHLREDFGEAVEVRVAVVEVVNHAHVLNTLGLQRCDDLDLVLGFAKPSPVVVEGEGASDRLGLVGERFQLVHGTVHAPGLLVAGGLVAAEVQQHPQLRLGVGAFEDIQDQP